MYSSNKDAILQFIRALVYKLMPLKICINGTATVLFIRNITTGGCDEKQKPKIEMATATLLVYRI